MDRSIPHPPDGGACVRNAERRVEPEATPTGQCAASVKAQSVKGDSSGRTARHPTCYREFMVRM